MVVVAKIMLENHDFSSNRSSGRRFSVEKLFLEISQNLQENICARVFF